MMQDLVLLLSLLGVGLVSLAIYVKLLLLKEQTKNSILQELDVRQQLRDKKRKNARETSSPSKIVVNVKNPFGLVSPQRLEFSIEDVRAGAAGMGMADGAAGRRYWAEDEPTRPCGECGKKLFKYTFFTSSVVAFGRGGGQ